MTRSALAIADPYQPAAIDGVAHIRDLRAAGMSHHSISARCRPSGPWRRLLPGVVLLSNAPPTRRQLVRAAMYYVGSNAVLTGVDAIHAHGLSAPAIADVLVLIPLSRRVASRANLTVERTSRLPSPIHRAGLPVAPLSRAIADAARHERDRDRLTTLLLDPVRAGACTIAGLRAELDRGNQRGTAAARSLLAVREHDVVPMTHVMARRLVRQAPLPPPRWLVELHDRAGKPLGVADAWWPQAGLAWNLGEQTRPLPTAELARPALAELGITVLHTPAGRLQAEPETVLAELAAAFTYAASNPHR